MVLLTLLHVNNTQQPLVLLSTPKNHKQGNYWGKDVVEIKSFILKVICVSMKNDEVETKCDRTVRRRLLQ